MKVKSVKTENNTFKKEGNKKIANSLICNLIDDKIDIMNKQRDYMNVKVIDESIKENDQSHQNVDNITDQSA